MSPMIKICGLSTPPRSDAALDAGADVVGFVFFAKSPRHTRPRPRPTRSPSAPAAARGSRRSRVDAPDAALEAIVAAVAPDFLQLHGRETPDRLLALRRRFSPAMIKAIGVSGAGDVAAAELYAAAADRLLFDAKAPDNARHPGGNGVAFDWRLLAGLRSPRPWLLSGGLDPGNVAEAIAATGARGVDVSSGVESAPGVKDIGRIRAFVAAAREAFARAEANSGRRRCRGESREQDR